MFQRARGSSDSLILRRLGFNLGTVLFLIALSALSAMRPAEAQVVAQYTWEDGGTDGWTAFNSPTAPVNTTAAAHGGTHSLLVTTNSSGQGGAGIQLMGLQPGATYTITGFVMLTSGEAQTAANFTVKRSDPGCSGGTCYDTVGSYQVPVTGAGWAQIGGTYTVSTTSTSLTLYAQLVGPTSTEMFYLDDVTITEIQGPPGGPQDNSGISTNFEDGGLDGWSPRISCTLTNTTAEAHSGAHSLLVTNRSAAYDGPQINVSGKMYNGSQYAVSVWVRLGPNATQADTLRVSLQITLQGTTTYHTVVNNTPVPLGQWVELSIPTYSMAFAYDPGQAYLYVESASGTQDFYIDDFNLTYLPPIQIQQNIPSIYQTLAQYFPVGAEIDQTDLSGPHAELLTKHFDGIVSGNDMKWEQTEPTEGHFTYTVADQEVQFAEAHGMKIRGHNLVWSTGAEVPAWVFLEEDGKTPLSASNPADVALLTSRVQNHIMNLVEHFGTAVYVWDVVNEPLDPGQPDCLQHGPFYQVLGASYIEIALRAARQYAPPGTQLFINDYSTTDRNRLECLVKLIHRLRAHDVPLDGVGHEMHNHIDYPSPFATYAAIETLHWRFPHLHQQVTELDVSVYKAGDNTSNYGANGGTVPQSILAEQGWLYEKTFEVFRKLKGKLDAVTFWGMADDDTWLDSFPINRLDMPLPFDTRLQAKPAYWGIVDPTQLPGYGLSLAVTSHTGAPQSQAWTITATNPSGATAYSTQINGLYLIQVAGRPCRAMVVPPSKYPVVLGDIPSGGTATASFNVSFEHCTDDARFDVFAPWSSAVYETGVMVEKGLQP